MKSCVWNKNECYFFNLVLVVVVFEKQAHLRNPVGISQILNVENPLLLVLAWYTECFWFTVGHLNPVRAAWFHTCSLFSRGSLLLGGSIAYSRHSFLSKIEAPTLSSCKRDCLIYYGMNWLKWRYFLMGVLFNYIKNHFICQLLM